jgi:putative ABC transport system permease protein
MGWFGELWRRFLFLFQKDRMAQDLADEMRLHLELRAEDHSAAGLEAVDAQARARRAFGNLTQISEQGRAVWGWSLLESLANDLLYGLRALRADPGFALVAVGSLALGIGANTAIFSILNAVMLRSLPVEDPQRLVQLESGGKGRFEGTYTNPIWEQIRDHQQAFTGVLAYSGNRFDLANGGESRFANGIWVSGDFFRVLSVPAIQGRLITAQDDRHGCGPNGPVAVISYGFWKGHFASDPNIVGRGFTIDRHPFQIIGVTPSWFTGLDTDLVYDFAIPIGCEPLLYTDQSALEERSAWWLQIVGRLPPGGTLQQSQARMNAIAPEVYGATVPANFSSDGQNEYRRTTFKLQPAATGFSDTRNQYRIALYTLMTVVSLVLLIACANVANLLLARSAARQREISIRLAVGAGRNRIVRQLLTESVFLSISSAAAGLLLALWGSRLLVHLLSTTKSEVQIDVAPDIHVLAFTTGVAILTAVLFGLAPALRASSVHPNQALKEGARGTISGTSRFNPGKALVTLQVVLSLVLLVGAGLFLGTLRNLLTSDLGFNTHNVLLISASEPQTKISSSQRLPLFARILERLREIPGVRSVSGSSSTPIRNWFWNEDVYPEGYTPKSENDALVYFNRVSPGYFQTLETPLLAGRDFSRRDNLAAPKVIIISESTARQFFGAANPIGKTINMDAPHLQHGNKQDRYEVIGVAKDIKYGKIDELPLKTGYLAVAQDPEPRPEIQFEIRSDIPLSSLTPAVRAAITKVSPEVSLEFGSFESQVSDSLLQPRLVALLSSFFGLLALLLAMVGLYGLTSYGVARRRGEIGIRIALGAKRSSVIWLVLKGVILTLALGTAIGIAVCLLAGRLVTKLLYGLQPGNPETLVLSAIVLALAATIAGYLPARRASRLDPMAALREE